MSNTTPGLAIRGLAVRRGGAEVLRGLDLAVPRGGVHGLVGRNGAGKTTLLDALFGFAHAHAGSVTLDGRPLRSADVAYLPADTYFYPRITGREYLAVYDAAPGPRRADAHTWAHVLDLPIDHLVDTYSAGMRRKLALAGALALRRPVLVLDEPQNALDVESNALLAHVLRAYAADGAPGGAVVLVTSHVLEALAVACDQAHLIEDGRVTGRYAPGEFGALAERLMSGALGQRTAEARALLRAGAAAPSFR